jgi:hypothetical protein
MAILAQDTFIRADQSGFGTASDGNTWTVQRSTQIMSIASNQGKAVINGTNTALGIETLSSLAPTDQEVLVNVTVGNTSDIGGAILRFVDTNNYYYCDIGNVSGKLEIGKDIANVFTSLASTTFSVSANTAYTIRFQVIGTTLRGKIWLKGSAEPGSWTVTVTDASFASGKFGVCYAPIVGSSGDLFDTFSANDTIPISTSYPRYVPRSFGATIIPDPVTQPLPYIDRGLLSTIVYESRTFIPRALSGVYIQDNVMWVPRALGSTIQPALLRSLTIPGVGTLTGTLSANTALSTTLAGVGTLTGTLSLSTALVGECDGIGTLAGSLFAVSQPLPYIGRGLLSTIVYENRTFIPRAITGTYIPDTILPVPRALLSTIYATVGLSTTLAGVGTLAPTLSTTGGVSLAVTLPGVGTLSGTLSLSTALSTTIPGVGTLSGTLSLATALTTTLAGAGTLTATLSLSTALSTTVIGVGTLAGVFSARVALSLTFAGAGTLSGTISMPVLLFLSTTCITRDMQAIATTRDMRATAVTRDEKAAAQTRDEQALAVTRDEKATAKTRG